MYVTSEKMELRGIANKQGKEGKVYYMVNVEENDGTSHSLYCPDANAFESGLKKGDEVSVTFEVRVFGTKRELVVVNVHKEK